jgi:hypothetical protein
MDEREPEDLKPELSSGTEPEAEESYSNQQSGRQTEPGKPIQNRRFRDFVLVGGIYHG